MNLPTRSQPEVPTFGALAAADQTRALRALSEFEINSGRSDPIIAVDQSELDERVRATIATLKADGHKVVIEPRDTESVPAAPITVGDPNGTTLRSRRLVTPEGRINAGILRHGRDAYRDVLVKKNSSNELNVRLLSATLTAMAVVAVLTWITGAVVAVNAAGAAVLLLLVYAGLDPAPAKKYTLTRTDQEAIAAAAFTLPADAAETKLAAIAEELAAGIEALPAWRSDYLAGQRLTFNPAAEAAAVADHARSIASMRRQVGTAPIGEGVEHDAVRAAIDEHTKILDALTESLRRRVAALWIYHETLADLDARLSALHALRRQIQLSPQLDALVQQVGADQIATDHLTRSTVEAQALTEQVDRLTQILQSTLAPRPADLHAWTGAAQ